MKIFKDYSKEFDKYKLEECGKWRIERVFVKQFIKEISNQIIDDMIGEERKVLIDEELNRVRSDAIMSNQNIGYNIKVKQLKEYKVKFNK